MKTINPFPTNGVQCAQKEKGIPLASCCFFHPLMQQDSNNSLSNNTGSRAIYHPATQAFKLVGFSLALTNPVPSRMVEIFFPLLTWSFAPEVISNHWGWGRAENTLELSWDLSMRCLSSVPSPGSGRIRKILSLFALTKPKGGEEWSSWLQTGNLRRRNEMGIPEGEMLLTPTSVCLPPQFLLYPGGWTQRETLSQGSWEQE